MGRRPLRDRHLAHRKAEPGQFPGDDVLRPGLVAHRAGGADQPLKKGEHVLCLALDGAVHRVQVRRRPGHDPPAGLKD